MFQRNSQLCVFYNYTISTFLEFLIKYCILGDTKIYTIKQTNHFYHWKIYSKTTSSI